MAIVTRYHPAEAADRAAAEFRKVFSEKKAPEAMQDVVLTSADLADGGIWIVALVVKAGFASSNGEARRLVTQGAVSIAGEKITDPQARVSPGGGQILKVGKRRFGRLVVE